MNRNTEVRKATKALADFYRVVLSKGRDIIKIREEISNVENYFSIQKIRYSNVFDFEIAVEEDILDCYIPKLTIQPLAENAIYHGLKMAGRKGIITIKGYKEKGRVVIKVSDDGAGMPPGRLNEILSDNGTGDPTIQSFGLKNLNERIKIFFGSSYGITVWSEEGKGTEITIEIPEQYGEDKGND
jgi:two-component system sensor histidine kinase YesM